jgi:hypothetical protein
MPLSEGQEEFIGLLRDSADPGSGREQAVWGDVQFVLSIIDTLTADMERLRSRLARNDEWMESYARAIGKVCDGLDAICLNATDDELRAMVRQEASGLRGWKGIACINEILNEEFKQ